MMKEYFAQQKKDIIGYLTTWLTTQQSSMRAVNDWSDDIINRLLPYSAHGKMIRGGLVLLAHEMFAGTRNEDALKVACAVELFHSAFLIHDDIMDKDLQRRGMDALHYQYQQHKSIKGHPDAPHFGVSMGICGGDISLFLAFQLLSEISDDTLAQKLTHLASKELSYVGLAQMQDVYHAFMQGPVSQEAIMKVYQYKTARYTFSLPLLAGALLASTDTTTYCLLEKLGEDMGLVFQIKDDELGLFGTSSVIGKIVGSDIAESKKTLYYMYLFKNATPAEQQELLSIFGHPTTQESLSRIITMIKEKNIDTIITDTMHALARNAQDALQQLPVQEKHLSILHELLAYNLSRTS